MYINIYFCTPLAKIEISPRLVYISEKVLSYYQGEISHYPEKIVEYVFVEMMNDI